MLKRYKETSKLKRLKKSLRSFPSWLLVVPVLIPLIFIILIPALLTVRMSFQRVTYGLAPEYVGLNNYIKIFTDPTFYRVLLNNVFFTFFTVAGQISIGLATAVLMSSIDKFRKLFISLLLMPYAVSVVVAIIIWKYMLEPDLGVINYVIDTIFGLGQIEWGSNLIQAWIVIIVIQIWLSFPFSFLILYSAILGISQELYDSAYIDGAGDWQAFRYITLPIIMPSMMVATIFGFMYAFRGFSTVWLLTQGAPMHATELLAITLYKSAFRFWEFGSASAIALVMTILTFLITIYYLRMMYRRMFIA